MTTNSVSLGRGGRIAAAAVQIAGSPAAWFFVAVWLGSALALMAAGEGFPFAPLRSFFSLRLCVSAPLRSFFLRLCLFAPLR